MEQIILKVEDTKQKLIQSVNSAIDQGVPCYFLEPILTDILVQVKNGARIELEKARALDSEAEHND